MSDRPAHSSSRNQSAKHQPQVDRQLLAALYAAQEEEIDLWEYWQTIWRRRRMILAASLGVALLAAVVSLLMPDIYRAEMKLAPTVSSEEQGKMVPTLGGLSGLASLAGIPIGGEGRAEEHLAVLQSREFIWRFVKDKKLMPVLFVGDWDEERKRWHENDPEEQPNLWDAYRLFSEDLMRVTMDKDTGLVTLTIDWKDPELAADWGNDMLRRLNEYQRSKAVARAEANLKYLYKELDSTAIEEMRQTLFELISQEQKKAMVANTQQEFAFRVLDAAAPPDEKDSPKRALIVVLATFVAGFFGVIAAFILEGFSHRRLDQTSREKDEA